MEKPTYALFRALTLVSTMFLLHDLRAQGLVERFHSFKVEGITNTMQEKRCQGSLSAFDPEMVVSIDRQFNIVKVKTMQDVQANELIAAMQQVGITATLFVKKEEHTDNDQQ